MGRAILSMALEETQQLRMLERLRSVGQRPVTLDQLRADVGGKAPPDAQLSQSVTWMRWLARARSGDFSGWWAGNGRRGWPGMLRRVAQ